MSTLATVYHPYRYQELAEKDVARGLKTMALPAGGRQHVLEAEWKDVADDEFEQRAELLNSIEETVSEWAKAGDPIRDFSERSRSMAGASEIVISELPGLRLPDRFYVHLGEDAGLYLPDDPNKFIDGAYFSFVDDEIAGPGYICTIVCDSLDFDPKGAKMADLLRERTRIAMAFIPPSENFRDAFDMTYGDDAVCRAIANTAARDFLALSLAFIADPDAAPDVAREISISSPGL
jgi:hypothetical protein